MGVLGRQQRVDGLDANGLARLLTDQKEDIFAAMPSGLARVLEASGVYQALGPAPSPDKRPYESATTAKSYQQMPADTKSRGEVTWPYWVLPLLALGALLWYMLPSGRDATPPPQTMRSATEPAQRTASEPAQTAPQRSIYITRAPDGWTVVRASTNEFINQDVFNRSGDKLGTIKEMLIGPDGRMAAAIINVGQHLGMGDKDVAVHFAALEVDQRGGARRILIDAVKENLQAAPAFDANQVPTKQ
jgi:hypothetical protein